MWSWFVQNWEALAGLGGLVTGVVSLFLSLSSNKNSKEANQKSNEANELSKKSLVISYDVEFNDFHHQLKENKTTIFGLKCDLEKILGQNKDLFDTYANQGRIELGLLGVQKKHVRPSEYSTYYEELENLGQDVISNYDIMGKILDSSDENNLMRSDRFKIKHEEALDTFDNMLKRINEIETKIEKLV